MSLHGLLRAEENAFLGKRVMLNTVTWMDFIKDSLRPQLTADPVGGLPTFLKELDETVALVRSDCQDGFKRCKMVLTRQQVVDGVTTLHGTTMYRLTQNAPSGSYVPQLRPHNINLVLQKYQQARNMTITVPQA